MNFFQPGAVLNTQAMGNRAESVEVPRYDTRAPMPTDIISSGATLYPLGKKWLYIGNSEWILLNYTSIGGTVLANWVLVTGGSGSLVSFGLPNPVSPILPDANGRVNLTSTGSTVTISGVAGGLGAQSINFEVSGSFATTYQTDSGSATPAAGILRVIGGGGASTSATGNTVTVTAENNFGWSTISASQTLAAFTGYFCISPGGALALALPSVASTVIGQEIKVVLDGATSFQITQVASQSIRIGNNVTTTGAGGSITTTAPGDTIYLVAQSSTRWDVVSWVGSLTVV